MSFTFQWMNFVVVGAFMLFDSTPGACAHTLKVARSNSSHDAVDKRKFAILPVVVQAFGTSAYINTTYKSRELENSEADLGIAGGASGTSSHLSDITLTVDVNGLIYELPLKLNKHLFASQYVEKAIGRKGEVEVLEGDRLAQHCYYIGTVKGHPGSTAAVSTCSGIVGSFTANKETYRIEPVDKSKACLSCEHKVYRAADQEPSSLMHSCGVHSSTGNLRIKRSDSGSEHAAGVGQRYAEVYVVNDYAQYTNQKEDIKTVCSRAKNIVNEASALYQSLDLRFVVVAMETWTEGDQIEVDVKSSDNTLDRFAVYRQENIKENNDHALLLSGVIKFDDTESGKSQSQKYTLGIAKVGQMCDKESVSLITDFPEWPDKAISTLAHELGHSLNMVHDDVIKCTSCNNNGNNCIMISANPEDVELPVVWSECSKEAFNKFVSSNDGSCLENSPPTPFDCDSKLTAAGQSCG